MLSIYKYILITLCVIGIFYFTTEHQQTTPNQPPLLDSKNIEKYQYALKIIDIKSQFFTQKKRVYIYTPISSHPTQKRPVIYQTDGYSFVEHWLSQSHQLRDNNAFIQPIIVGIDSAENRNMQLIPPYLPGIPRNFNHLTDTPRGQGDQLLQFIKTELVPSIEKTHSHNGVKILSGFSLGGLFTLYALSEEPDFFSAYFAFSPSIWVNKGEIIGRVDKALHKNLGSTPSIYISRANEYSFGILPKDEEDNQAILHYRLGAVLSNHQHKLSQWRYQLHANTSHYGSPALSIPYVLRHFL